MTAISEASILAEALLAGELPSRYAHVRSVAARAVTIARTLGGSHDRLVVAAWLHDLGYAPSLADTGFHPLDGARFLANAGYGREVVQLVAFHSAARIEAAMRGMLEVLVAEFDEPDADELALLTYCDMTTGPHGQSLSIDERLADILDRYAPDDVVHQSIRAAESELRQTVRDVEMRVRAAQSQ